MTFLMRAPHVNNVHNFMLYMKVLNLLVIITLQAQMGRFGRNVSRCSALFFLYIVLKLLLGYFNFFLYKRNDQYYKHRELHGYCEN